MERRRELWSERSGWRRDCRFAVCMNAYKTFGREMHSSELLMTPDSMVTPLGYLGGRPVRQAYVEGVPELVWEELNCASETQLRGNKLNLYFEAGVRELWYFQADTERVEVLRRGQAGFESIGWFGLGDELCYGERRFAVAALFEDAVFSGEEKFHNEPEGVGLQQVLTAGLPCRRFEYWDGWCRRFLPCRWLEQALRVGEGLRAEIERWDTGRFPLHQRGQVLELATRVDPRLHREVSGPLAFSWPMGKVITLAKERTR